MNKDGQTTHLKEESLTIQIKPTFKNDTVLEFPGKGHQKSGFKNSDIICKIQLIKHERFSKKQNDLYYTIDISLLDALNPKPLEIVIQYF